MTMISNLSIVIPAYNFHNPSRILAPLLSLNPLEIIVVDSSPMRPSLPEDARIKLIYLPQKTWPGAARNIGWKNAQGKYILFVDSDVEFTNKTQNFVRNYMQNQEISTQTKNEICFGVYASDLDEYNSITKVIVAVQRYRFLETFSKIKDKYRYSQSSHVILRKDIASEIGYFNPSLRIHEDKELCIRAENAGINIVVYPEFEANHLKIFSLKSLMLDHFDKSFLAIQYAELFTSIFSRVSLQMATKYKLMWLSSSVAPLILFILWFEGWLHTLPVFFLLVANFFLPLVVCQEVFSKLALREKLTGLWLWPCMGIFMTLGSGLALINSKYKKIRNNLSRIWSLLRCAWRVLFRTGMPINIVHFITSRCNLRCSHCFYKETLDSKDPGEQSLEKIDKVTSEIGAILWYAIAGGEPFVRQDLVSLVETIYKNTKPVMLTIPTNGWYTEKTFFKTLEMLQKIPGLKITLQVSLDGPQSMHDKIRGDNSWNRAEATFKKLKLLQSLYPNLTLSIITVVNETNYHCYPAFVDELIDKFAPNQIAINLFRNSTLDGPPVPSHIVEAYKTAVDRYEWHISQGHLLKLNYIYRKIMRLKEVLQKELIYKVMRHNEYVTPCMAGTLNYVIWENGNVSPCEVLGQNIGNILGKTEKNSFKAIIKNARAKKIRKWIRKEKCKCSYECAMTVNTLFSWPMTRKLIKRILT